jgi:hypothetical protein
MDDDEIFVVEELPVRPNSLLSGFRVEPSDGLIGSKRAVQIGDTIHVSPAMWDLMKNANQNELQHLLSKIEVINLGESALIRSFVAPTVNWSR